MKNPSKLFGAFMMAAILSTAAMAQQIGVNNAQAGASAIAGATAVGVGVGVGGGADVDVRNSNTNLNTNINNLSNRQMQGQLQGQLQGQRQTNINGSATSGNNQVMGGQTTTVGGQSMTYNEAAIPSNVTIKNTPSFAAGNVYPTAPCMGGTQVGGVGAGFGFSVGSSWTDENCQVLETARNFESAGYREDALVIRCQAPTAAKAPSCIALKAKEDKAAADAAAVKQAAIAKREDKVASTETVYAPAAESTIFSIAQVSTR